MSARRLRSSALLLLALALSAGCSIAIPPPRQTIGDPERRALDLLTTRWRAVTDLRTLADVSVDRGGERNRVSGVLLAKAPDNVRFEALSPFGQPFLVATIHDGHLTTFNAVSNQAMVGDANTETTARLLGIALEPRDLVAVVTGHAVPPDDVRTAQILPADALGPSLSVVGPTNEQRIWMDFNTGVIKQLQIVGGRTAATVTYQRDEQGNMTGFDLSAAERWLTGTVRYRNLATDVGLTPEQFALTLPKDAKTQPIR